MDEIEEPCPKCGKETTGVFYRMGLHGSFGWAQPCGHHVSGEWVSGAIRRHRLDGQLRLIEDPGKSTAIEWSPNAPD